MNTKQYLTHSCLYTLLALLFMFFAVAPSYAQTPATPILEPISISNLDKLEMLASWQPDNGLFSLPMTLFPANNADVVLVENRGNNMLRNIDLGDQKLSPIFHFVTDNVIYHESISPNGQFDAVSDLQNLDVWNVSTGKGMFHIALKDDSFEIEDVAFSPNNDLFAYTVTSYPNLSPQAGAYIYDISTGQQKVMLAHSSANVSAFSPDGKYLASAGFDGSVRLWDLQTGDFTEIRQADGKDIDQLNFVNSSLLAVGFVPITGIHLEFWDTNKGEMVVLGDTRQSSYYLKDGVSQIRVRKQDNETFQLWSILDQKDLAFLQDKSEILDINAKSNLLITGSFDTPNSEIQFRQLDTGEILHTISEPQIFDGKFSASGNYLILYSDEGKMEIWGVRQS